MRKHFRTIILAIIIAGSAYAATPYHNVVDFGAVNDGKKLNSKAIQAAIDKCHDAGGGTVYFPAGRFVSGTLYLKDNITLFFDAGAVLLGSTNLSDYPPTVPQYRSYTDNYTERSLIYAERVKNISIMGRGILDGQGQLHTKERLPYKNRPYMIRIIECKNVTVRDVTIQNSPMWVQHYLACENVIIDGIIVESRHANYNGDGIDIDSCDKVRISNCWVNAEDDAIVLKATSDRVCKNVTITNCVLSSHCNAFKCGTESNGGFQDITVSNCTILDTRYSGIALELVDGGEFNRVTVSNITMKDVNNVIFIRLGNRARPYLARSAYTSSTDIDVSAGLPKPPMGSMQNIMITNIQATGVGSFHEKEPLSIHRESYDPRIANSITGLPGYPVKNVTIENVRISSAGGGTMEDYRREIPENPDVYPNYQMLGITPAYGFYCRHVENIRFRNIDMDFAKKDVRPAIVFDDVRSASIFDLAAETTGETPAVIDLKNASDVMIQGCKPKDAMSFLHVAGPASSQIIVMNNDLSRIQSILSLAPEAAKQAVFFDFNRLTENLFRH
jgi:hypothetical protein